MVVMITNNNAREGIRFQKSTDAGASVKASSVEIYHEISCFCGVNFRAAEKRTSADLLSYAL